MILNHCQNPTHKSYNPFLPYNYLSLLSIHPPSYVLSIYPPSLFLLVGLLRNVKISLSKRIYSLFCRRRLPVPAGRLAERSRFACINARGFFIDRAT